MDDSPQKEPVLPPLDSPEARRWITILHISALAGFILVGFGQILGPLIVWLLKKNDVQGLDAAGRNVLNFQISWTLWWVLSFVFVALLGGLLAFVGGLLAPLAFPLAIMVAWVVLVILGAVLLVAWVILVILGAVRASNGEPYRFPLTIRFFN